MNKQRSYHCMIEGKDTESPLAGIFFANAIPTDEDFALCSCQQNAAYDWRAEEHCALVQALWDISEGEEVCVFYGSTDCLLKTSATRAFGASHSCVEHAWTRCQMGGGRESVKSMTSWMALLLCSFPLPSATSWPGKGSTRQALLS